MAVDRAFNTFLDACATSNGYVSRAHTQDSDGKFHLNKDERDLVTVAAFLRLFIAWESFLEETFVLYMMGKLSRNGLSVKAYVSPVDVAHASRMLLGVQRQKFIDWSTPDTLRALAPVVFHQGGPFGAAIDGCHADLLDMKIVRNATAHSTSSTYKALNGLASRKLGRTVTNFTPPDLLLSTLPGSFPPKTLMQSYVEILQTAAEMIANG